MKEYRTMRMFVFYYMYLLVIMVFTAYVHWFHADLTSTILLIVLLGFPLLAGKFLYRDNVLIRQMENRKGAVCHEEFFGVFFVLSVWGVTGPDITPNYILYCLLGCADFGLLLFSKYYYGKYLTLYCNPSVTKTTRMRAEGEPEKFFENFPYFLTGGCFCDSGFYPYAGRGAGEGTDRMEKEGERKK